MKLLLLALAAQAAASSPTGAPPAGWTEGDWVLLAERGSGRYELDRGALRLEGDLLRVRVRADLPDAPGGVRWGMGEIELDCRAETQRLLNMSGFDTEGALLHRNDEPAPTASPPSSEAGRANIVTACRQAGWGGGGAE